MNMTNTTAALRASVAGSITQILQLGSFPGELVRISEPMSPLTLTCGMWAEPYRSFSMHIPENPGCYILIAEDKDGEHVAYVGEAGNICGRLRTHEMPKKHRLIWFAALSSFYPFLSKTHIRAIEAGLYRLVERFEGLRILGTAPPIFPMSPVDTLISDESLQTAKRLLAHAGLPLGLSLPPEPREVEAGSGDGSEAHMLPRTYATYRFTPGPGTCYAELHAIGSDLDDGFLIHAGAEYRPTVSHTLPVSIVDRRGKLERQDYLEPIPGIEGRLRLKRPIVVSSAMVAARVLAGYAVNDVGVWTPLDGTPLAVL